jgi:hypothetical protein
MKDLINYYLFSKPYIGELLSDSGVVGEGRREASGRYPLQPTDRLQVLAEFFFSNWLVSSKLEKALLVDTNNFGEPLL